MQSTSVQVTKLTHDAKTDMKAMWGEVLYITGLLKNYIELQVNNREHSFSQHTEALQIPVKRGFKNTE